jgi:mRNA interferase RelE/StbE
MYKIYWTAKAQKQLVKIGSLKDREAIYSATGTLKDFPSCRNVVALINHKHGYRLRVGRYRVMFDANTEVNIIDIEEVKKRDDQTY